MDIPSPASVPTPQDTPHLAVREAAARLGITPRAVRQRIEDGRLVGTMIDGRWYVPLASVEDARSMPHSARPGPSTPPSVRTMTEQGEETPSVPPPMREEAPMSAGPLLPDATRASLEAVMREWLTPLVDRIAELERERGHLEERAHASEERAVVAEAARTRAEEERATLLRTLAAIQAPVPASPQESAKESVSVSRNEPPTTEAPGPLRALWRWFTGTR